MRKFSVLGCGLYTPHFAHVDAWLNETPSPEAVSAPSHALDRRSRRISGDLMRALTSVALESMRAAKVDPAHTASVYGSALGEVQTMVSLLQQIWVEKEPPSPMAFAASVHNAASGVASISFKNQGFTTSVAANFDTPAMSLFEGATLLATGTPHVLVACGDESSPDRLMGTYPTWKTMCAAVVLSADPSAHDRIATLTLPTLSDRAETQHPLREDIPNTVRNNPSFGMLRLVDAIVNKRWGTVRLDAGDGRGWNTEVGL